MKTARLLILTLLILTILPWGAYVPAYAEATAATAPETSSFDQLSAAPAERAAIPVASRAKIFLKRKCRTAKFPGSPCGPDVLLQGVKTTCAGARVHPAPRPPVDRSAQGVSHAPPREPPRLI